MSIAARTQADPANTAQALKQEIWKVDSQLPVTKLETMSNVAATSFAARRFNAVRISRKFMTMVRENYLCDKTIREKYDVVTASAEVNVQSGYKQNVIGFGWSNAAYEKMQALVKASGLSEEQIDMPHRSCVAQ